MMMPASREVLLHDIRGLVLRQDPIHLMLLAPQEGLGEHLSSFLYVEVSGAKEPEESCVAWHLRVKGRGSKKT